MIDRARRALLIGTVACVLMPELKLGPTYVAALMPELKLGPTYVVRRPLVRRPTRT